MTLQAGAIRVKNDSLGQDVYVPPLSRWFIRTAVIYLALSLATGVVQVTSTTLIPILWPTYTHFLVVGWLTQLIFGVALWLFPRRLQATSSVHSALGWGCYWLLNLGLLLRAVGEPARAMGYRTDPVLAGAALLQLLAGWIFGLLIWPRIRER